MTPLPLGAEPEAKADILEAFDWYEKQREGLGREFIKCVDDVFEQIAQWPEHFAVSYRDVRQALVRRFPYVVCFKAEKERISVIAVFHGRRDPTQWHATVD